MTLLVESTRAFFPPNRFTGKLSSQVKRRCVPFARCVSIRPQLAESWQGRNPHPSDEMPALDSPVIDHNLFVVGRTAWRLESARWRSTKVVLTIRHLHVHGV